MDTGSSLISSFRGNIATAGGGSTLSIIATGGGAIETGGIDPGKESIELGRDGVAMGMTGLVSVRARLEVLSISVRDCDTGLVSLSSPTVGGLKFEVSKSGFGVESLLLGLQCNNGKSFQIDNSQ